MRERIEALGGTLTVTGARERGTQVDAFIPADVT
jgi:signal transduction histidine kinase